MARFSLLAIAALLGLVLVLPSETAALSSATPDAQMARGRLSEALASPSGKMTLSPEIVIPEPTDPTALLLQATAVTKLSDRIRTQAKANSAWIAGAISSVKSFSMEQESARGNFPGPVPIIFCPSGGCSEDELQQIASAGACGVLISALDGNEIASVEDLASDEAFANTLKAALALGIQPIPEVVLADATAASFGEEEISAIVDTITNFMGTEPVSLLVTVNALVVRDSDTDTESDSDTDTESDNAAVLSLPAVPKALGKRVPILGSIRVAPGGNRMGFETARLKEAGFTGAVLRSDCVPGFRMNPDLEVVGKFWSACIGDLKSLKSKNFSFRARTDQMEKSVPLEWAMYQKDVMESGALGLEEKTSIDSDNGDFQGF